MQIDVLHENNSNKIQKIESTILRHTTDNMQHHIQKCMVQTVKTRCQFAQDKTRYVSYQNYYILFIHS
jgi:hypothetical protein